MEYWLQCGRLSWQLMSLCVVALLATCHNLPTQWSQPSLCNSRQLPSFWRQQRRRWSPFRSLTQLVTAGTLRHL